MSKNELLIIADYAQVELLSYAELCQICRIDTVVIGELIANDVIRPQGSSPADWQFDMGDLARAKRVLRLRRELDVDLTAAVLVMDLLEEMRELRAQVELVKKHYL